MNLKQNYKRIQDETSVKMRYKLHRKRNLEKFIPVKLGGLIREGFLGKIELGLRDNSGGSTGRQWERI